MHIETLISDAKARQAARTNEYRAEQQERAARAAADLEQTFAVTFGANLFAALYAHARADIDASARITFNHGAYSYSLRHIFNEYSFYWQLTRLDPRDDDDERRLPSVSISETRGEIATNIDAFVLALDDLDSEPETPRRACQLASTPPPPTVEQRLISALREIVQQEIYDHDGE
jgi:hypothetical protein